MSQPSSEPAQSTDRARGLGRIGIWSIELRFGDRGERSEAAAELDELGYGALWIPGGFDDAVLGDVADLLAATRRAAIATGIVNIWKQTPADVAAWWRGRPSAEHGRTMLGIGVSHAPLIGSAYANPLGTMGRYLDGLDAAGLPVQARCLAALGPKMLDLARDRSAGAHPYLVSPDHTARARERLGPAALLAPEQGVILETDPARARDIARAALGPYLNFPNYVNNWRRLGFSDEDVAGSDRLIDAIFAWGSLDQIARRVAEHHAAGADHVCLQVLHADTPALPRQAWRDLASALL
jgi:probable F420-dependent oxidoreductase